MAQEDNSGQVGRNSGSLVRERTTVTAMIRIYCHDHHKREGELCAECGELLAYAMHRLDRCPFGVEKPKCADCSIHCYRPEMQSRIRQVMRYAGPKLPAATAARHGSSQASRPSTLPKNLG